MRVSTHVVEHSNTLDARNALIYQQVARLNSAAPESVQIHPRILEDTRTLWVYAQVGTQASGLLVTGFSSLHFSQLALPLAMHFHQQVEAAACMSEWLTACHTWLQQMENSDGLKAFAFQLNPDLGEMTWLDLGWAALEGLTPKATTSLSCLRLGSGGLSLWDVHPERSTLGDLDQVECAAIYAETSTAPLGPINPLLVLDVAPLCTWLLGNSAISGDPIPSLTWHSRFVFDFRVLQALDIVPVLLQHILSMGLPIAHRQRLYTILAEMSSNAVDHGLLLLDSSMKTDAQRFRRFYVMRADRLHRLQSGSIEVRIENEPFAGGGVLHIEMQDSGLGFPYQQKLAEMEADPLRLSGRGVRVLRSLCRYFEYAGRGNIAHAAYEWRSQV